MIVDKLTEDNIAQVVTGGYIANYPNNQDDDVEDNIDPQDIGRLDFHTVRNIVTPDFLLTTVFPTVVNEREVFVAEVPVGFMKASMQIRISRDTALNGKWWLVTPDA